MGGTTATRTWSGTSGGQVFNQVHGRDDNRLIATEHSCEINGCNTMPIRGHRTQLLLMMAI